MAPRVRVRAPGKINVYLAVGPRHDDGYHALATVFQAVSLFEDVVAEHDDAFGITVTGDFEPGTVPEDDRNLALRAAHLLASATGYTGGVHLTVHKSVPVAGGMGGGSADAAAALVACNALWQTGYTTAQLHELAAHLGADVPFALHGGTAIGAGRGDQITPVLAEGRLDWVLVTSEQGISTPQVYARLDDLRDAEGALADDPQEILEVPARVLQALRAGDAVELAGTLHNDLADAALGDRLDLVETLDVGVGSGALGALVSGSGPTIALLCSGPEAAQRVQHQMQAQGYRALHVHGPVPGARVID